MRKPTMFRKALAIAVMVSVVVTLMGTVYFVEDVIGAEPSVV